MLLARGGAAQVGLAQLEVGRWRRRCGSPTRSYAELVLGRIIPHQSPGNVGLPPDFPVCLRAQIRATSSEGALPVGLGTEALPTLAFAGMSERSVGRSFAVVLGNDGPERTARSNRCVDAAAWPAGVVKHRWGMKSVPFVSVKSPKYTGS